MSVLGNVSWTAARVVLAATGPLQRLVDPPGTTHLYLNQQALYIMRRDGLAREAAFLEKNLVHLQRGVRWADTGWKNVAHYLDPRSGRGITFWPGAAAECERYFARAAACWRRGNPARSLFYLGAAAHLVQDLCVPHHAGAVPFSGHQAFEKWAGERRFAYRAVHGSYDRAATPGGWVTANAREALAYLPQVLNRLDGESFHRVAAAMMPLAQATTAGFLAFFLRRVAY